MISLRRPVARTASRKSASSQALVDVRPHAILVETCDVQTELLGVPQEIVVFERLLRVKKKLVHGPETVLEGSCLGGGGRAERVRMDLDEREVPEGETNAPAQFLLDILDRPKRLPGVGALVVAVLENETTGCRPAGVVDLLVQWRQTRPDVFRQLRLQVSLLLVGMATRVRTGWSRSHPPMASPRSLSVCNGQALK